MSFLPYYFTYTLDAAPLEVSLDALAWLYPDTRPVLFVDSKDKSFPVQYFQNRADVVRTHCNRQRNLNGEEFIKGMMHVVLEEADRRQATTLGKFDSDCVLLKKDTIECVLQGSRLASGVVWGNTLKRFTGVHYVVATTALRACFEWACTHSLHSLPDIEAKLPEDMILTRLLQVTGAHTDMRPREHMGWVTNEKFKVEPDMCFLGLENRMATKAYLEQTYAWNSDEELDSYRAAIMRELFECNKQPRQNAV